MLRRIRCVKMTNDKMKGIMIVLVVISFIIGFTIGYVIKTPTETTDSDQFEPGENLLFDSGFEYGDSTYWHKAIIEADNLSITWDETIYYNGSRSASINNTHVYEETVVNNWAQAISDVPINRIIELSGYVKTLDAEIVVMVIQCWDKDNNIIGFGSTEETTNINGTTDWTEYIASVYVPENTQRIIVRLCLVGTGQVWFDDVTLVVK